MRALLSLLFPPVCVHCFGLVEGSGYVALCSGCAAQLEFLPLAAAVRFDGPARSLVLALKFRRRREVLPDIETIFRASPALCARARGAVLVPVPLDPARERERGFNQSRLLAAALARAAGGGSSIQGCLRREPGGRPQSSLRREERLTNVKNAFAVAPGAGLNPLSRHLIIDDVTTTGSTLESCAHALRAAGCRHVDAIAFAQG